MPNNNGYPVVSKTGSIVEDYINIFSYNNKPPIIYTTISKISMFSGFCVIR